MKSPIRLSLAVLVLAGVGYLIAARFQHRVGGSLASAGASFPDSVPVLQKQSVKPTETREAEKQDGLHVSHALTSATIEQALPGMAQSVTNWREFKPNKITISPYPDTPFEFEMTSVRDGNGRTVWTGRNSIQGAFLVTAATENDWHAVLSVPGASSFEFHISGQTVKVTEQADNLGCGTTGGKMQASIPDGPHAAVATMSAATPITASAAVAQASTATIYYVDVLFFYDAATLAANGGDTTVLGSTIIARVAAANLSLENSGISMRWNYLTAVPVVPYTATGDMANDLSHIESMNSSHISDPVAQDAWNK